MPVGTSARRAILRGYGDLEFEEAVVGDEESEAAEGEEHRAMFGHRLYRVLSVTRQFFVDLILRRLFTRLGGLFCTASSFPN